VPEGQDALVNGIKRGLRGHPFDHRRFRGMRQVGIAQRERVGRMAVQYAKENKK
jgi:hypothetical protein